MEQSPAGAPTQSPPGMAGARLGLMGPLPRTGIPGAGTALAGQNETWLGPVGTGDPWHGGARLLQGLAGTCRAGSPWWGSPGGVGEAAVPLGVLWGGRWAAGSADSAAGWAQRPACAAINQWSHSTEKLTPARTHPSRAEGCRRPCRELPPQPGLRARPPAGLTREGVVGVEEVDLLAAVPVDVAGRHTDGVALPVPQCIVRGTPVVLRHVHQPPPCLVVLEHQVGAIVPVGASRGDGSLRLGDRMKAPIPSLGGYWVQTPAWSMETKALGLLSAPICGACSWLPTGRAQPGAAPAHVRHPVSTWPGYPQGRGWVASRAGWGTGPCLQPFPRAGKLAHKANPLGGLRPTGSLTWAPVNKLHNGRWGRLQNHSWLLGSAPLGAVSWAPLGVPSAARGFLPQGDAQRGSRVALCLVPWCPGSCSPPKMGSVGVRHPLQVSTPTCASLPRG